MANYNCKRMSDAAKMLPPNVNDMLPAGSFNGKVAFVTGGGTGIGRGIATTLSRLGASVVITSRLVDAGNNINILRYMVILILIVQYQSTNLKIQYFMLPRVISCSMLIRLFIYDHQ